MSGGNPIIRSGNCRTTDRDAVFVGPFRVTSEFDDEFGHADVLDDKEGRLPVRVCQVDVASAFDEVAEDIGVAPRGGGV